MEGTIGQNLELMLVRLMIAERRLIEAADRAEEITENCIRDGRIDVAVMALVYYPHNTLLNRSIDHPSLFCTVY